MSAKHTYITTTLPYVNSDPHVGFALEIVEADFVVRHKKLLGEEVFFNTGTDEHGIKIYRKAQELGIDTQKSVDEYATKFKNLKEVLTLSPDIHFIRTTDAKHKAAAQEFWKRCEKAGDIYKKNYKIKYCVGCELEKTDSELVNGHCPIHPNLEIEIIEEENYFFKFSKYQKPLLDLYAKQPDFVVPSTRLHEITAFVERGLEDFSISRLKSKMPWGVDVPGDSEQIMYVWFDALVSYISTIGWPESETAKAGEKVSEFKKWWPVTQFAGKDNLRQQSAMWQSMLMSAGIAPSRQIVIHGFITSDGQKMSKSLGNVIDPLTVVAEYGSEPLRYYLLRAIHPFEDSDFTMEKFKEFYNAHLANGLGNTVSRIMKMATGNGVSLSAKECDKISYAPTKEVCGFFDHYEYNKVLDVLWSRISTLESDIQTKRPFSLIKTDPEKAKADIKEMLTALYSIAADLEPCMPATSATICALIRENKMPDAPLFLRKD